MPDREHRLRRRRHDCRVGQAGCRGCGISGPIEIRHVKARRHAAKTDGYQPAAETWVESSARGSAARRIAARVSRLSGSRFGEEQLEFRPGVIEVRSTEF